MSVETEQLYRYVRFSWWSPVDLREAEVLFRSRSFTVGRHVAPRFPLETASSYDNRDHLTVMADTLQVFVTSYIAILFQREEAPFTERDKELRKMILAIYRWTWSGEPIPLSGLSVEPEHPSRSPALDLLGRVLRQIFFPRI